MRLCPAYLCLMQMRWTQPCACLGAYMRVPAGVRTCASGGTPMGGCVAAQALYKTWEISVKNLSPSRMTCKGLVLLFKVFIPLPSLTHLNGLSRPLRVPFTLFSRTSTTIHCLTPDKHLVSVLAVTYKHHQLSSYAPVEYHYRTWVDSSVSKTE